MCALSTARGQSEVLPINADLAGTCLLYLDSRSLLQWGAVSRACRKLFASEAQKRAHLQRLLLELHHAQDSLKAISHMSGAETKPIEFGCGSEAAPACLNIGHKGAEGHIHGNTMASFHQAVKMGVDVIEFDVVACADGVLCHHDPVFEATGEWFEDLTVAEVRRRLGGNHPTLTEMLSDKVLRDSGVHLYFDLKHNNIVRPTMRAIVRAVTEQGWPAAHIIVATFKQIELLEVNAFRRAIPELRPLRTAVILDAIPISLGKEFAALGCAAVSVGQYCATAEFIADCHRRGLKIWAWTVNAQKMVDLLVRRGIDGVCTDYPELVTDAISRHRSAAIAAAAPVVVPAADGSTVAAAAPACERTLGMIYNELAAARGALVAAVAEAKLVAEALKQRSAATLRGPVEASDSESAQLTALLLAAAACAEEVLQPVLLSSKTFQWAVSVMQTEGGRALLKDVATELATVSSISCPLLPFERKFLISVSAATQSAQVQ